MYLDIYLNTYCKTIVFNVSWFNDCLRNVKEETFIKYF